MLSQRRRRPTRQKLEVEPLEPRILLSADLAPFAVAMDEDQNDLTLSYNSALGLLEVHDNLAGTVVASQARAETSSVIIAGTEGDDRLVMDTAGTYIFPDGVYFDAAGGNDSLVGPDFDSTWIIDGIDSGTLNGEAFTDVEQLFGGAANEDLFSLLAGGQITGGIEGGDGGFDTLEIGDGGYASITSSPTGPASGSITLDGITINYDGLEPVLIASSLGSDVAFDLANKAASPPPTTPGVDDVIELRLVSGNDFILESLNDTFEDTTFTDPGSSGSVTINLGAGADVITLTNLSTLDAALSITGGDGEDTFILGTDYGTVELTGGDDDDRVAVLGSPPSVITNINLDGDTITTSGTSDGQATLTDPTGFTSITGDSIVVDLSSFSTFVDNAFAEIEGIFEYIEAQAEFAAALPLISGTNLEEAVDVTLGKALGLQESITEIRIAIGEALDGVDQNINAVQNALNGVAGTVKSLGAALIGDVVTSASEIAAATATDRITLDLSLTLDDSTVIPVAVDFSIQDLLDVALEPGDDRLDALLLLTNAAIGSTDAAGRVGAVERDGRVGLQVVGSDVAAFEIVSSGAASNIADTLLGLTSMVENDVKGVLTSLGDLDLDLSNVALAFTGSNEISFDFTLDVARSTEFAFDFGAAAEAQGLEFDADAKLELGAGFRFAAGLVLDSLGFNATVSELGVGFEIDGSLSAEALAFGFLSATADGDVEMDAAVLLDTSGGVSFTDGVDPATFFSTFFDPANVDIVGFDYNFGSDTFAFQAIDQEGIGVDLTVTADAGLVSGNVELDFTFTGTDIFDSPDLAIAFTGNIDSFVDFNNLTPSTAITALADLILWLDDVSQSEIISGIEIPFVEGGLDAILDIAGIVSDALLYDRGGDGEADGDDKLVTDINSALAAAGLDPYLRAAGNGAGFVFEVIDDAVTDVDFLSTTGSFSDLALNSLNWDDGDAFLGTTGALALTGILGGSIGANVRVTLSGGKIVEEEFSITADALADNIGIGDDVAKLLDAFNSPNFGSAIEFAEVLEDIGLLPSGLTDLIAYDEAEDQLTYAIEITDKALFDLELPADFELDLAPILDVSSDTRLVLSGTGSLQLVFGFDLTSNPGPNDLPSASGEISGTTKLSDLGVEVKTDPAVTVQATPRSVVGVLTSDASFVVTAKPNAGAMVSDRITVTEAAASDNETLAHLITDINNAIATSTLLDLAANPVVEAFAVPDSTGVGGKIGLRAAGGNLDSIRVQVDNGDPALSVLGFQPDRTVTVTGGSAVFTASSAVSASVGVISASGGDATFSIKIGSTTTPVTVKQSDTFSTSGTGDGIQVTGLNRNILDLAVDVQNAVDDAELGEKIEVGFQGTKLVFSLIDGTGDTLEIITGNKSSELGITANKVGTTDDLIVKLDGGNPDHIFVDLAASFTGGNIADITVQDVLDAITEAKVNLTAVITPDDDRTPENEGGSSLTVGYNAGGVKLMAIEATNASPAASALGIVGLDVNPFAPPTSDAAVADGSITGSPIGGVTLADRFFIAAPDNGSLADIASFTFEAQAAHLATEISVVKNDAGFSRIVSPDLDFRDFDEDPDVMITIRDVAGFTAGDYAITGIDDLFGDGSVLAAILNGEVGEEGQGGGVGIVKNGVGAEAGIGFIDVTLDGTADFGAKLSLGLNTGVGSPAADEVVTLGEVLEAFEAGSGVSIFDILAIPNISFADGETEFGKVDLEVGIEVGSTDFGDVASALIGGGTPGVEIDILALGDPFLKTRFDQAGALAKVNATTIEVMGDFTDRLADGATLRFELANGQTLDGDIDGIDFNTTKTDFTTISFSEFINLDKTPAGTSSDLSGEAADLANTGIVLRPSADVTVTGLDNLAAPNFAEFGIDEILIALETLVNFLQTFEEFDFLAQPIPVLERSVSDLVSLSGDLLDFIDELRENPASSLQFVEDAINDAIGISGTTLAGVFEEVTGAAAGINDNVDDPFDIGYDATENMFTFELTLGTFFSESLDVAFEGLPFGDIFDELGLDGVLDIAGSAGLEASGGVLLTLGLGFDIDEFVAAPTDVLDALFLLDSTGFDANLNIAGTDLSFSAGLGPFALAIQSDDSEASEIQIDVGVEVTPSTSFDTADFVSIGSILDAASPLDEIGDLFDITGPDGGDFGQVSGQLPVFFPNDSSLAGIIKIGETADTGLGNLANIGGLKFTTTATQVSNADPNTDLVIDISELVDFFSTFNFDSFSLFDNIKLAADGFDSLLELLETTIFGNLSTLEIPLVGDSFADAATFIGDFRTDFVGPLRQLIDDIGDAAQDFTDPEKNIISELLFDLLGPDGLDILLPLVDGVDDGVADYIGLFADPLDAALFGDGDLADALIAWDMRLGQDFMLPDPNIGFDIGIPGLGLEAEGEIDLELGWELALGFGISTSQGFFIDVSDESELEFSFTATPSLGTKITGTLGFLQVTAVNGSRDLDADGTPETTMVEASFGVDIFETGADDTILDNNNFTDADHLGFTEFGKIGIDFGALATASAVLDLELGLSEDLLGADIARNFPSVIGGFNLLWEFDDGSGGLASPDMFGDALSDSLKLVSFNDVAIDGGEFLTGVLGPIVDTVADVTEPLQPIIDFLTAPIPILNELGVNLTMLDVAAAFGNVNPGLINSIAEVITLINTIAALPDDASLIIPLIGDGDLTTLDADDFIIFGDMGGPSSGINPFSGNANDDDGRASILSDNAAAGSSSAFDKLNDPNTSGDQGAKNTLSKLGGDGDSIFGFPILSDPGQIFGLILGEPVTLVTADLEPLVLGFEYSQFFSIFGPLGISINLVIEAAADFAFGFDTQGIQDFIDTDLVNPFLIFNGLYVSDRENADGTGADVPELTFFGGASAAAELNLGIARAGVAGGLFIEILFDLFDPDDDGKVRIPEIISNIENQLRAPGGEKALAPLAIFDVAGEIFARLFAFLKIDFGLFEIDKEFDILDPITILSFEIDFFRPPVVATELDSGDLVINVGDFAAQRLLGNATDFGETIYVRKTGASSGQIDVEVYSVAGGLGDDSPTFGNAFAYKIDEGANLIINAAAGDDTIVLQNFLGDEVVFLVDGGEGNDTIRFEGAAVSGGAGSNTGFNRLTGGSGIDNITGSGGKDLIIGGAGDDTLMGGDGADLIIGDGAEFFPTVLVAGALGNDGSDTLGGGIGNDIIIGGGGRDTITGNAGDDLILGDGGEIAFKTEGLKVRDNVIDIWGAITTDPNSGATIVTDAVSDADDIDTGAADNIDGGTGNDIIFAGAGDDTAKGGDDQDIVFGGEGFDRVEGGGAFDILFGDSATFLADYTGFVSTTPSLLDLFEISELVALGPSGAGDTIIAGLGADLAFGGVGNDTIYGGNEELNSAGDGGDLIFAGAGADVVRGGTGNDDIRGEGQPDSLFGEDGQDRLDGGTGGDDLSGGADNDLLIATQGSDELNGDAGDDTYKVFYQGGTTESLIKIFDSSGTGDILQVFGTDLADNILLRANTSLTNAFIANLNGEFNVERVQYTTNLERIVVNGGFGNDHFAVDDTAAEITINGEFGDDTFQVGQLFRTQRNVNLGTDPSIDTGIDDDDFFLSIEVTRGWLSNGISFPMTINGGDGNDNFTVFHNKAVLSLNGEDGDDVFEVRAFALVGSQEPQRERTDLSGGAGADLVRYAVNAPVNIDGGDGLDTLVVIGTEFGDDIVITDDGVFGAGLNVNFVNIENLRVDGAEGDDRFFLKSTSETVLTEIFGGLGSDTFFASGDTPPVVSNDFRGHSGIIAHDVESGDGAYDEQKVFGISANVADNDEPFAVLTLTEGSTIIAEGDAVGDTYTVVLTRAPTRDVQVIVGAPLPSPDARDQRSYFFRLDSTAPGAVTRADGSQVTLTFTAGNWATPQEVTVLADNVLQSDTGRLFTRDDVNPPDPTAFVFDDAAFEGLRNGVITHLFQSREVIQGVPAGLLEVVNTGTPTVTVSAPSGKGAADFVGRSIAIDDGPGFGEQRFIIAAAINAADELTLTLNKAWNDGDVPQVGVSSYQLIIDDALSGVMSSFTETKDPDDVFADRSTFTDTSNQFGSDDSLIGRVIQIIGGPGEGQELLILGNTSDTLTLNGVWTSDPVAGESVYRIGFYDGLNSQVVEVQVNDNDTPSLLLDQTRTLDNGSEVDDIDTITAVIEGSDGDQLGENDVLKIKLNKQPSANVTVELVNEDGELVLSGTTLVNGELTFTNANWNTVQTVTVSAADDILREGFHTGLITFLITSTGDTDGSTTTTDNIKILGTDPVTSIGLSFDPLSVTGVSIDSVAQGTDSFLVVGNKIVFIEAGSGGDINSADLREVSGEISVSYSYALPGFDNSFAQSVLVRIADDDAPSVLVRETGGSTDVIEGAATDEYQIVLTSAPADGETVKVYVESLVTKTTKTGGIRHDEIQVSIDSDDLRFGNDSGGDFILFSGDNWDEAAVIAVTAIDDTFVDGGDTKVFAPGPNTLAGILGPVVLDGAGGSGSLSGLNDPLMLPGELNVKPATGTASAIDNDAATITIDRADLDADLLEELRIELGSSDGFTNAQIEALVGKTVELTTAATAPSVVDQFRLIIDVAFDSNSVTFTLNETYDLKTGEDFSTPPDYAITAESLNFFVDESTQVDFLFVNDEDSPADSSGTLTANRLFGLNMGPDLVIAGRERLGGLSFGNLEVLEINLGTGYNTLDVVGTPTRSDGFQTWTLINTGTEIDDPNVTGERIGDTVNVSLNAEEIEVATGTGGTGATNPTSPEFTTRVTLTGATFADDALVGFVLEVTGGTGSGQSREIASNVGAELTLVDPLDVGNGGVVQFDGTSVWRIVNPADGAIAINTEGGDDLVDAAASSLGIVVFGGEGVDDITTGSGDDIVFGDLGRVDYVNAAGAIVTRLGTTPDVITGNSAGAVVIGATSFETSLSNLPIADESDFDLFSDPSETADTGLAGLFVDINNGTGFLQEVQLITANTASALTVDPAFVFALDTTSEFRISTTPEDQTDGVVYDPLRILAVASDEGGVDTISSGAGNDVIIGGEAGDTLNGDADNDVIFGDLGVIENVLDPANPSDPEIGDHVITLRDSMRSIGLGTGADDTIAAGAGNDLIIGGVDEDTLYGDDATASNGGADGDDIILGDAGLLDYTDGVLNRVETYRTDGDADEISGNAGADIVLGGLGGDTIYGDAATPKAALDGDDLILGDHGAIVYDITTVPGTPLLESITGVLEDFAGADTITGDAGNDIILGGTDGDFLYGDDAVGTSAGLDGNDLIVGDTGSIVYDTASGVALLRNVETLDIADATGGSDLITGNAGADILIGGIAEDTVHGDAPDTNLGTADGDDRILGDNGALRFGEDGDPTTLDLMTSFEDGLGDADTITGNAGNDWAIGGYGGDTIDGNGAGNLAPQADGADVLIGDNGEILLELGNLAEIRSLDVSASFASNDTIQGHGASDVLIGGIGSDGIHGDASALTSVHDAADVILGDNGELFYNDTFETITDDGDPAIDYSTLDLIRTTEVGQGDVDTITASIGNDLILGGRFGDRISAGTEDDLVLGDFGRIELLDNVARYATITDNLEGGDDTIFGDEDEDVLIGGAGSDRIDGDSHRDLIFGDNVTLDRIAAASFADFTDPRFRTLSGSQIYGDGIGTGAEGEVLVDTAARLDPTGAPVWRNWEITILDHDLTVEAAAGNNFGDDYIAGGGDQDMIFAQLGDDTVQGDGSIDGLDVGAERLLDGSLSVTASFETTTADIATDDGDDYIEGNGGADVIFGNLGQDDIIGDNSDLFSLGDVAEREPVGGDILFGGAGLRIDRNAYIEDVDSSDPGASDIALVDRHSRDSDMVMGDNGRIYRLVELNTGTPALDDTLFLEFVYDQLDDNATEHYAAQGRGAERIVVRAAELLDYTLGGPDVDAAAAGGDLGAADEIHGESGDDFIYGQVGNDILFGDSDDDDIIAGYGDDWASGGTGQDGIVGGDGRIWTSKNTSDPARTEGLYGIGTVDTDQFISTPGKIQQSTIHLDNALKKTVDLTPFQVDTTDPFTKVGDESVNDDDILFGGLGSDFLHGGFGSDAVSGAEAMPGDVTFSLGGEDYSYTLLPFSFDNPGNPGDILNYGGGLNRPTEFAAYDEFNPRPIVFVDPANGFVFADPATNANAVPFVLNFDAQDGLGTDATVQADGLPSDGADVLFGDLGHDWLVGGTDTDRLYGGFGDDMLNADDDHSTDNGFNQSPDTADSYADIAYGGAGRDILIANTGGDRLIDWVGEFNSYIVPFAPFGAFTISRNVQPQIYEYLYDLSEADGADPTRIVDGAVERNGEPFGEIGAVKQQDPFWQDQTGAPDDPQPGNIPGGKRDVMGAEDFNSTDPGNGGGGGNGNGPKNLLGFAADSGNWSLDAGRLVISPHAVGQDAVSVYHVSGVLPVYFEMAADIAADKDRFGYDSNGFMIYDYQGPDDFKFAGINQDINKIQIGHRDANGWHVDVQNNMRLRADVTYHMLVAINGTTVTALVDGSNFLTHTYTPRMEDGIPQGINKGYIGFGADNSTTRVDNFAVQVLPPDLSYEYAEDFEGGNADYFGGESRGAWAVANGVYTGTPDAGGMAYSLIDLSSEAGVAQGSLALGANSKLRLTTSVQTEDQAGLIFDVVAEDRFKFAVLDVANDAVQIGHYEGNRGLVIDNTVSLALNPGQSYDMSVLISGLSVSVEVDGVFRASHAFNAVAVDGPAGVLAIGGAADFADASYATDDAALATSGDALRASEMGEGGESITVADSQAIIDEAVRRLVLSEELSAEEAAYLQSMTFTVADLEGDLLATEQDGVITFDIDGAGNGWFVDPTAQDDAEFHSRGVLEGEANAGGGADGKMDLLTVAMHELGHALGYDHVAGSDERAFMIDVLDPSQRLGLFDDDAPTVGESGGEPPLLYDARLDSFVTAEEVALLNSLDEEPVPMPAAMVTGGKGKDRSVLWT